MHKTRGNLRFPFFLVVLLLLFCSVAASAQTLSPKEIVGRAYQVLFYSGNDMKAKVRMRLVSKEGSERIREMTMLRKNLPEGGQQRFFIYFHIHGEIKIFN